MRDRNLRVACSLGLLALLGAAWRGQWAFQFGVPRATGGWQLLAATLLLFALWLLAGRRAAVPTPPDGPWLTGAREWLAAGALCALGIGFRVVHFWTVPGGMNHDAAFNGMYALFVLQGAPYAPYVSAAWGRETLFMYLCTPLVAWLGNVPEAIQIAGTLVAFATLPVFYLLARALCGRRVALVALALLAVSGWHGVFSRVGWRMMMVPPFEVLALLGLWRALQRGARRDWLLAGVGAALAIYTYDAGRLILPMVVALLAVFTVIDRDGWRARLLGGLVVVATFAIVGAPMLWYAATHFEQFNARAAHLAVDEPRAGGEMWTVLTTAGMFNYRGNGNDFFVEEPLLEPLAGALFVFGMLVVLWRIAAAPGSLAARGDGVGWERRRNLFIVVGLAVALLPGVLSVPNGNRCIAALPFVYLILGVGAVALADAIGEGLPFAPPLLLAALIAAAGVETYREYIGPGRRPIIGFSPEATAAGGYLRRFGDDYTRYIIAEDWPEYTLTYLSYNGGGTPLEGHYVLGRRFEDIEERINRFGRKGLVFVTDMKPTGRAALERLQRMFAEHRVEVVSAPRLGGAQVATALIVEPQNAAHAGLWSNTTRALAVGGDAPASALRCFDPVGDLTGVSVRLQLMRPEHSDARAAGEVRFLAQCPPPPKGAPLLKVGFDASGLGVHADHGETAVDAAALESGRWYEVEAALHADGGVDVSVDGHPLGGKKRLLAAAPRPPRIAGIEIAAQTGGQVFVDDLAVAPGIAAPGNQRWAQLRQGEIPGVFEDFEATPYGLLAPDDEWRRVDGPVSALASPSGAARAEAAPPNAGNAFDGGRGDARGQFNEPVGVAVDQAGNIYVGDRSNHRVQQFTRDGSFVRVWGKQGDQAGEFREPHDVAVDAEFVYVADLWNQRVQVFDHTGTHVFTITGTPSLNSPRGLAVKDRLIYVAEAGGGRISVYDRAGTLRQTMGVQGGSEPGHLIEPVDVAVDTHGDVWVVNSGNNRLEHFAPDGTPRGAIPVPGWTGSHLKEVYLAIDAQGTLYVSDWEQGGVRRFRPDGSELAPLGTGIRQPSGVALDRNRVLVAARAEDVIRALPLDSAKPR